VDDLELEVEAEGEEDEGGGFRLGGGGLLNKTRSLVGGTGVFFFCLYLLVWNEGAAKRQTDLLGEVMDTAQKAQLETLDINLDGKLVHIAGPIEGTMGAKDPVFNMETRNAGLYRQVFTYQWIEYSAADENGEIQTYYEKDWSAQVFDSDKFKAQSGHTNPEPRFRSEVFMAEDAKVGAFSLDNSSILAEGLRRYSDGSIDSLTSYVSEEPDQAFSVADLVYLSDLGEWPREMKAPLTALPQELLDQGWSTEENYHIFGWNKDRDEPKLGSQIIYFIELPVGEMLSILAQQSNNRLLPWRSSAGEEFSVVRQGVVSLDDMVGETLNQTSKYTSSTRWTGLIGATLGAAASLSVIGGFLRNIPVIGSIARASLWLVGAIIGFLSGVMAIIIGWFAVRPWVAYTMLGVLLALLTWRVMVHRNRSQERAKIAKLQRVNARARELEMQRAAARGAGAPPPLPVAAGGAPVVGKAKYGAAPGSEPPPLPQPQGKGTAPAPADLPALDFSPSAVRAQAAAAQAPPPPPKPSITPQAPGDVSSLPSLDFTPSGIKNPPRNAGVAAAAAPASGAAASAPAVPPPPKSAVGVHAIAAKQAAAVPAVMPAAPQTPEAAAPLNGLPFDGSTKFEAVSFVDDLKELTGFEDAPPEIKRIRVASKDEFAVYKVVQVVGEVEELQHFELVRGDRVLKQGSQIEVQAAAKRLMAGER
jgi:hypothetical protein